MAGTKPRTARRTRRDPSSRSTVSCKVVTAERSLSPADNGRRFATATATACESWPTRQSF